MVSPSESDPLDGYAVPVLIIGFNRPDLIASVIDELRKVRPQRLYVSIDGPRADSPPDALLTDACAKEFTRIDWPCSLNLRRADTNLGAGLGPAEAISWFFSFESQGVILEDDVLPDETFFPYVEKLLARFLHDDRVIAVTGCNFNPQETLHTDADYRFSCVPQTWGWATWADRWGEYKYTVPRWWTPNRILRIWAASGKRPLSFAYWLVQFTKCFRQQNHIWDYQFTYLAMTSGRLTATPNMNVIENIGFGESATHTKGSPSFLLPRSRVPARLRHPDVQVDGPADAWLHRYVFGATWSAGLSRARSFLSFRSNRSETRGQR